MDNFSYDELECEHVDEFAAKHEFFFMDDEPEYDVFDFDDGCSLDFITKVASTCDTYTVPLNLKPLPDSLKDASLGHDEFLPIIIVSDLNKDQE